MYNFSYFCHIFLDFYPNAAKLNRDHHRPITRGYMTEQAYTSRQVIAITGVTNRQLAYWRKTGLILPSKFTPGGHARYSFTDIIAVKAAKQLIDAGVSVQRLRKSIVALTRLLPNLNTPLSELSLVATGDVVLIFHQGAAFEALSGQEWILPIAQLQRNIEQRVKADDNDRQTELFPELTEEHSPQQPNIQKAV
jgi:DNA-binding transcriptional MerR regulator